MSAKAITDAFHARMVGDAPLVALLAADGGAPNVLMSSPVPENTDRPFIVSDGNIGGAKDRIKNSDVREIFRDIRAFTDATGNTALVEQIIDIVHDLFHHQKANVPVAGFTTMLITASDPITAPSGEGLYGRMLTVRMLLGK
jgi:hypothetical protein